MWRLIWSARSTAHRIWRPHSPHRPAPFGRARMASRAIGHRMICTHWIIRCSVWICHRRIIHRRRRPSRRWSKLMCRAAAPNTRAPSNCKRNCNRMVAQLLSTAATFVPASIRLPMRSCMRRRKICAMLLIAPEPIVAPLPMETLCRMNRPHRRYTLHGIR